MIKTVAVSIFLVQFATISRSQICAAEFFFKFIGMLSFRVSNLLHCIIFQSQNDGLMLLLEGADQNCCGIGMFQAHSRKLLICIKLA